ncbi:MAG: hypothetical protein H3C32_12615 [Anaerolineae bacterium]|nr:MAG: hypothetical protein UZ13_02858 [Chloroflexi bacterium OLB13]MBW7880139.1 hypothetical protein [Anaerolineae bacterium]OQY86009.1 MAG: hypothetical protein B6D42_02160 [Anaerolineae bacterium UTCFX5]
MSNHFVINTTPSFALTGPGAVLGCRMTEAHLPAAIRFATSAGPIAAAVLGWILPDGRLDRGGAWGKAPRVTGDVRKDGRNAARFFSLNVNTTTCQSRDRGAVLT